MTTPLPCACGGHLSVGDCPSRLRVCLKQGLEFDASIQLKSKLGVPENWPVGTTARMVFNWGTGYSLVIASEPIVDSWLRFHMSGTETEQVPRGAKVEVHVNYAGEDDSWRGWLEGVAGCR